MDSPGQIALVIALIIGSILGVLDLSFKAQAKKVTATQTVQVVQTAEQRRTSYVNNHHATDQAVKEVILGGRVRPLMTMDEVRASWGEPARIETSGAVGWVRENWFYPGTILHFRNGILESWQQ